MQHARKHTKAAPHGQGHGCLNDLVVRKQGRGFAIEEFELSARPFRDAKLKAATPPLSAPRLLCWGEDDAEPLAGTAVRDGAANATRRQHSAPVWDEEGGTAQNPISLGR